MTHTSSNTISPTRIDSTFFPKSTSSLISRHGITKGMNLQLSHNKSSGFGESCATSPHVEFTYMALNPWKFNNITIQGQSESFMRLQEIYSEYHRYYNTEEECIFHLTKLLYVTLDTFTRRERLHIIDKLVNTGLLSLCWNNHTIIVTHSDELTFSVHLLGKELHKISFAEKKECISNIFFYLAEGEYVPLLKEILLFSRQESIDYTEFLTIVDNTRKELPPALSDELLSGCIDKKILVLSNTLLSLIAIVPEEKQILFEKMHYILSAIRTPILEHAGLFDPPPSVLLSQLDIDWNLLVCFGENTLLPIPYALGNGILRFIHIIETVQGSIIEEKSILWLLSSIELFIDAVSLEYEQYLSHFFSSILKNIPIATLEKTWERMHQEDYEKLFATFTFANSHVNNTACQRIYLFLVSFRNTLSSLLTEQSQEKLVYTTLFEIDEHCLSILSRYDILVEEVYLLHRMKELLAVLNNNVSFHTIEKDFFATISACGEQYYKALQQSSINKKDKRQQENWATSLLHRIIHSFENIDKDSIASHLQSKEYLLFEEKHPFLQSHTLESTWFGSWLILSVLKQYALNTAPPSSKILTTYSHNPRTIFERRASFSETKVPVKNIIPQAINGKSFAQFAKKCTESSKGIHFVQKNLATMNVSQDVLVNTYLRIAVQNKLISSEEATEIYTNLKNTEGVDIPLFKVNLSNTIQLKGHLHELRMASTASLFGFNIHAMNKIYQVQEENKQYEVDILMKKYDRLIGIEVKDLADSRGTNFKDILDGVKKMGAFKRYQGDATMLSILTQSGRPPVNDKFNILHSTALSLGVEVLYGGIREQLLQIDALANS
ncbi:MAG: hypothetical protein ACRCV3_06250 [Desulfovibrionaceae bacterium]